MKIVNITDGLGNQMFQYAFAMALKERLANEKVLIDIKDYKRTYFHNGYELEKIFNIELKHASVINRLKVYNLFSGHNLRRRIRTKYLPMRETIATDNADYNFHPEVFDQKGDTYYIGFWQSEKYFKEIENKIREVYHFPEDENIRNHKLKAEISNINSTSIHIRRGDYLNFSNTHNICDLDYYRNAVSFVINKTGSGCFVIFSDDIDWCRTFIVPLLEQYRVILIDWNKKETAFRDMELMSCCRNNIIANSTFSWWSGWLNAHPDKMVIAPSRWMRSGGWDDIIPDSWIRI